MSSLTLISAPRTRFKLPRFKLPNAQPKQLGQSPIKLQLAKRSLAKLCLRSFRLQRRLLTAQRASQIVAAFMHLAGYRIGQLH
jgi:hypothetical protein